MWENAIKQALEYQLKAAMEKGGFKPNFQNSKAHEQYSREAVTNGPSMLEFLQAAGK